jgi:hypothetical protein
VVDRFRLYRDSLRLGAYTNHDYSRINLPFIAVSSQKKGRASRLFYSRRQKPWNGRRDENGKAVCEAGKMTSSNQ